MNTGVVGLIGQSRSESFRRLNAHLLAPRPDGPIAVKPLECAKNRLRQKTGPKLNKTELAYFSWLLAEHGSGVRAQSVTLVLANGVRYTPDFVHLAKGLAWETKGFMRDDAAVKIKFAAAAYPEIRFHLVTRNKLKDGGKWDVQVILP